MFKYSALILGFIGTLGFTKAQPIEVPFDSPQWETSNAQYTLQRFEGKDAILLQSGIIYLKDVDFMDGTIEVDMNFSSLRNFPGIGWRMQDNGSHEHFYVRPHQSGNPDANQYTPVFYGLAGWQLYHGEKYATPIDYKFNEWHHVKIVVAGNQAQVYFDDMDKPLLEVQELLGVAEPGTLSLNTRTNVHFANFQYTPASNTTSNKEIPPANIEGLITTWELSESVDTQLFKEKNSLSSGDLKNLSWADRSVESSGVLNIARYTKLNREKNSVMVRLNIQSDQRQLKKLSFGYSDVVKVFVNGQAIYEGANTFRTRDYRYLGTIGYFDAVFLPLQRGKNEIVFMVTENFGGWGLQGVLKDRAGIEIE